MRVLHRRYQHFALWLAVAAVLLRTLIPEGFMLDRRPGGHGMSLVFCYAGALAPLRDDGAMAHVHHHPGMDMGMAHAQHDPAHHHDGGDHASCAFASAAAASLPVSMPGLLALAAHVHPLSAFAASAALAAARLRPPARAPPRYA